MPAYVESLPSDRVTHMLGRPIQYLVTDSGDLGNVVSDPFRVGFNPYATARIEAEPKSTPVSEGSMDDVGSSLFIEVADLQGLGCGGSIAADLSDCPCPQFGMSADDGAMGEAPGGKRAGKAVPQRVDRAALAGRLRVLAGLERVLVDAEKKVLLEAADLVERNRSKRRACGAKVAECKERLKGLRGSGMSGERCPKTDSLVLELQRLSRLDRALQGAERQVLCESARRIAGIRANLRKARAELAQCRASGGNVGAARLRAKLEACQKRYDDHMREAHGR